MDHAHWLKLSGCAGKAPSLADVLETLAYHTAEVHRDDVARGAVRRGGCGLWADPTGPVDGLHVHLDYEIRADSAPDSAPVWDQCYVRPHGSPDWEWVGNRCGLRTAIARAYAPVIAAVAAREAADADSRAA
jgi:hypothetical protein